MRRSDLKSWGIEDAELIDKILDANGDDINREKAKIKSLETELKELKDLKSQMGDVDVKKIEAERDDWKSKFENLEKQNKAEKEEKEFNDFLKSNFDEFKVRDEVSVKANLDFEKIKASKDRTKEIKEQLTNVQKEKAYLFNSEEKEKENSPIYTYTPNGGKGGDITEAEALAQELEKAVFGN